MSCLKIASARAECVGIYNHKIWMEDHIGEMSNDFREPVLGWKDH
jgi:hypothetical protein